MKKTNCDYFKLTPQLFRLLTHMYPRGFGEDEVFHISDITANMQDSIKLVLDDTVFLVKKSKIKNFVQESIFKK